MNNKEQIYNFITDEGEERVCDAISEEQCSDVPGNFLKNAVSGFSSKLAEQLVSPGITLPWILSVLGASPAFTGLLVPLKNAGSLLPQLFISAKIRAYQKRKYFWGFSGYTQSLMILFMFLGILFFDGNTAGYIIVGALFLFSVASGIGSVSFKDVMGKTIPKGRRGRLLATRATGGGLLTLGAGLLLYFVVRTDSSVTSILWMVGVACVLWFLAGFFFLLIKEQPGATEGGRTAIDEAKDGFQFLKENRQLRNFIISRALLMAIPLAQPFFIVFGKEVTNADFKGLGLMIIVSGIAGFISSPFWGKFADRSSKNMMRVVALLGILNILTVLSFPFLPEQYTSIYAFAPLILINMMIHGGARLSRKTWLTDFAPEKERPLYIATANTMIGLFTLVAAGIGFIAELLSIEVLFVFLISMLLGSIYFTSTLKDV